MEHLVLLHVDTGSKFYRQIKDRVTINQPGDILYFTGQVNPFTMHTTFQYIYTRLIYKHNHWTRGHLNTLFKQTLYVCYNIIYHSNVK